MFAFGFMLLMMGTHFQDDEIVELNEPTGKKKPTHKRTHQRRKAQKQEKKQKKEKKIQNKTMKIKKEENGKSNMKL